jgi:hypothetical protein
MEKAGHIELVKVGLSTNFHRRAYKKETSRKAKARTIQLERILNRCPCVRLNVVQRSIRTLKSPCKCTTEPSESIRH